MDCSPRSGHTASYWEDVSPPLLGCIESLDEVLPLIFHTHMLGISIEAIEVRLSKQLCYLLRLLTRTQELFSETTMYAFSPYKIPVLVMD